MATLKDIAAKLNVSTSTVSKGMNGAPDISESMRQLILDTAVELGYTKRSSRQKDKKKICLFFENIDYYLDDDFGHDIILGFKQAAFRENWDVEVIPLSHGFQKKRSYDAFMLGEKIVGSMICGFAFDDPWMKDLETTKVPTVLFDNYLQENPYLGSVGTDSLEGMELAVRHLVSLGHERIAYLAGPEDSYIARIRTDAYRRSMRMHHLPVVPELIAHDYFVYESAKPYTKDFLEHGATAILCGNDLIAEGVIDECKKAGLSVPDEVSVLGYDDLPSTEKIDPPLSTIRQDRLMIGKSGYYILHALINGVPLSRNLIRPRLIVRGSTAMVKPR
ncbi:MAG: LacI family DNA-binding transcriptional regulator [Lachnospiraceae bacterium]|nr:LacI family DNA-binding transcriptional regulator [Lachnospiraceae bacterium]